jgi:rhodanese-related sulfurtransferase
MVLPLGGCSSQARPPATPAATKPQATADLDVKPFVRRFLANLPADWNEVPAEDVAKAKPFVVDVRQPDVYAKGFIEGAVNIPLRQLTVTLQALPAMDKDIVVVCNSGHSAAIGMAMLQMLGYKKTQSLEGGMEAWRQAKLSTVTGPVPARPAGQAPQVNDQLQAALNYYLVHTLPVHEGAMSPASLTWDQQRKSSMELEENDTFDQGRSILMVVDGPDEFEKVHVTSSAMNFPLRGLVDSVETLPPTGATIYAGACKVPNRFNLEPKLSRFVVVSTSQHRAALGMMSMQLAGFHFVSALEGDVIAWRAGTPTA